ncbi:hypothetical protein EDC32_101235 [Laceyella sacchari]|nr:hypothetical protein EDC32_101235 [Laceyella sacchari]
MLVMVLLQLNVQHFLFNVQVVEPSDAVVCGMEDLLPVISMINIANN